MLFLRHIPCRLNTHLPSSWVFAELAVVKAYFHDLRVTESHVLSSHGLRVLQGHVLSNLPFHLQEA